MFWIAFLCLFLPTLLFLPCVLKHFSSVHDVVVGINLTCATTIAKVAATYLPLKVRTEILTGENYVFFLHLLVSFYKSELRGYEERVYSLNFNFWKTLSYAYSCFIGCAFVLIYCATLKSLLLLFHFYWLVVVSNRILLGYYNEYETQKTLLSPR